MIKRVLQDKWPIEKARAEAEAIGLQRTRSSTAFATEYIKHRAHQVKPPRHADRCSTLVDGSRIRPSSAATATRWSTGSPTTSTAPSGIRCCRASRRAMCVARCPRTAPEQGEPFDAIFADFERVLVPALTHWNHPGFFAYFAITASAPGVLAEFLVRRAQPAGDALAHVAGGHRARGGRARLAARADGPAGRVRRRHLRHGVDRRRCTRWRPRAKPPFPACASTGSPAEPASGGCASTAPSTRIRRSTRR